MRSVSVLVPCRDEERHLADCLWSILTQQVDASVDVIVVDAMSVDRSRTIASELGVTVLDNPTQIIPAALNIGLAAARGDVIVRFDAHAEMPPGYLERCLSVLDAEPGAGNIGGWRQPVGGTRWGEAVARALASRLGVGNPRIWREPASREREDVDSVPLGCFARSAIVDVGGWNESLPANEDYELNVRLRKAGYRVVFEPALWSLYRTRDKFGDVVRQYARYGRWKARVVRLHPSSLRPRQAVPVGLLVIVAGATVPSPLRRPATAVLGAYGGVLVGYAAWSRGGWRVAAVLAAMHLSWAGGAAAGIVAEVLAGQRPASKGSG